MKKIGFIGTGNMGFPMLKGAIKEFGADCVTYTAGHRESMERVLEYTGVPFAENNSQLIEEAQMIVLCVKPQFLGPVYKELREKDLTGKIIISVAAGVSIAKLREETGQKIKVVRAMPNTPAMVGEGMSSICFSDEEYPERFSDGERADVRRFFASFGRYAELKEGLIDAAMCANGCSPAYVYMFIEALADGAVKYGIPRKTAYELAAQTVLGSAKMVLESGLHPGALKDNVCSPGGTTIAGVAALEEAGFRSAVIKATDACYGKAQELAGKK